MLHVDNRMVFRERSNGRGFDRLCVIVGDSVESNEVRWAWWGAHNNKIYAVTNDGVIRCVAKPCHLGRSTQVWDATVTRDGADRTLARFSCTQLILWPRP